MTSEMWATSSGEPHTFHSSLLREYDIRGIVGTTLSVVDAHALGQAFGTIAGRRGIKAIAVGRDGRLSSPMLADSVSAGLTASGLDVVDIGCGPTPMLYFATHVLPVGGGVMVTGSHNPPDYNGFKLTLERAPFFAGDIQSLGRIAAEGDYAFGSGKVTRISVFDEYIERVLQDSKDWRPLNAAWDAGNGAMGEAMAAVASRLPGRHVVLNDRIDGRFPSHHPDPTVPENLRQLRETVLAESLDLGIAFDGDGDRLGVVDSKGHIIWGDQLLLLLARDLLRRSPGATVIGDVKCSQVLFDGIAAAGGYPLMWKTGHSLIKAEMKKRGAPLAGEMSGHIFIADRYYGYDDALYAAIRVLSILQTGAESLSTFRESLPQVVNTPEIRIPCADDRKFHVVDEVSQRLMASGAEVERVDGVRVHQAGGWWLLRASNTQDILVVRCEASSRERLDVVTGQVRRELAASGIDASALDSVCAGAF